MKPNGQSLKKRTGKSWKDLEKLALDKKKSLQRCGCGPMPLWGYRIKKKNVAMC
jgi:hypothetical protein